VNAGGDGARRGILAAGNWIVDRVKRIDVWPGQDLLANILDEATANGGSPYNLLVDLARLQAGFPLEAAGLVGQDADGAAIRADCARHRIGTAQLGTAPDAPTSYTDVMTVAATGRRTFFHRRGANARFGPEHLDLAATGARILHLGYLLLLDCFDEADPAHGTVAAATLARARALGLRTSIDVVGEDSARLPRIVLPALPHCDYCTLNEDEAGRCTGITMRGANGLDWTAMAAAARALIGHGVKRLAVIHAPEGALACAAGGAITTHGATRLPPERIAGAVGAGDAFAAGVLLGLHDDLPVRDCLRQGIAAATASLLHPSASDGVLPLAQCLALADGLGYRATSSAGALSSGALAAGRAAD
jgi:sugar/nucleoside kinase (ribokinase family)